MMRLFPLGFQCIKVSHHVGKLVLQPLIAVVILAGAAAVAFWMAGREDEADKGTVEKKPPLVTVFTVTVEDVPVQVEANGTVRARNVVTIVPQVEGHIINVHPSLRSGGFFAAGDVLVELDPTDYEIQVQEAKAQISQRGAALKEAEAAISEFAIRMEDAGLDADSLRALFAENSTTRRELEKAELALRRAGAQHEAAVARRDSAAGGLQVACAGAAAARLRLERTRIALPYAGRVISESAAVAQYVVHGQALAEVYRTDVMEVVLPLEDWELAWFDVGSAGGGSGAAVEIETEFAGAACRWAGRTARLEGTVDPRSRMVRAVIDVTEPGGDSDTMLMPGMFVTARIAGRMMKQVATLPRRALRANKTVWIVEEQLLRMVPVQVVRQQRTHVFVRGLAGGARVVSSALDVVVDGMAVRPWSDAPETAPPAPENALISTPEPRGE